MEGRKEGSRERKLEGRTLRVPGGLSLPFLRLLPQAGRSSAPRSPSHSASSLLIQTPGHPPPQRPCFSLLAMADVIDGDTGG